MNPNTSTNQTILLRADEDFENASMDKFEKALGMATMAQSMLVSYYEDTIPNVQTPHLKKQLEAYHQKAKEHLEKEKEIYGIIGRDPSKMKEAMGGVMSEAMEGMANLRNIGAGAYSDLQQLMMLELMSTGMLGTTKQLAVALGIPEAAEIAKKVVMEKFGHWRWFQEAVMELAPVAILDEHPI